VLGAGGTPPSRRWGDGEGGRRSKGCWRDRGAAGNGKARYGRSIRAQRRKGIREKEESGKTVANKSGGKIKDKQH